MYRSLAEIVEAESMSEKSFWQVVLEDDIKERGITYEEGFGQMIFQPCRNGVYVLVSKVE